MPQAAAAEAALLQWRQREEERWRGALKKREGEVLAALGKEWEAKEAERERASARQRRGLAAAEAELRGKVAELEREQRRMRGVEAALTAKVAAAEQKAAHEAALRQATHQGELAAAQAALGQASGPRCERRLFTPLAVNRRHSARRAARLRCWRSGWRRPRRGR